MTTDMASPFARFARQKTIALTTFRKDGTPVPTAVSIIVDGDRAYFRTYDKAGKYKRLRRDPHVEIAPSNGMGRPTGPSMRATARLLSTQESLPIRRALRRKYPFLQGFAVPLFHRLKHLRTLHYELTATED